VNSYMIHLWYIYIMNALKFGMNLKRKEHIWNRARNMYVTVYGIYVFMIIVYGIYIAHIWIIYEINMIYREHICKTYMLHTYFIYNLQLYMGHIWSIYEIYIWSIYEMCFKRSLILCIFCKRRKRMSSWQQVGCVIVDAEVVGGSSLES